jgi:hypothetical protein
MMGICRRAVAVRLVQVRPPDILACPRAEGCRHLVTDIQVPVVVVREACDVGVPLHHDVVEDGGGLLVDGERVNLEDDLDHAVGEGKEEINDCEFRHCDAVPLMNCLT